jgi:hypothetical protein
LLYPRQYTKSARFEQLDSVSRCLDLAVVGY